MLSLDLQRTCPRCSHVRQPGEAGPDYACPACGVVYAKAEQAQQDRKAAKAAALDAQRMQARRAYAEETAALREEAFEAGQPAGVREARKTHLALAHFNYVLMVFSGSIVFLPLVLAFAFTALPGAGWIASHYRWQARTFLGLLLGAIVVLALGYVVMGAALLRLASLDGGWAALLQVLWEFGGLMLAPSALLLVWYFWRVFKGWRLLFAGCEVE